MHDVAILAKSLDLGKKEKDPANLPRSVRAGTIRQGEREEALTMYRNIQRRMNQTDPMSFQKPKKGDESETRSAGGSAIEEGEKQRRPPIMLMKVLRRQKADDDDTIPQQMLVDAFSEIDEDHSGSIDIEELVEALRLCDLNVSQKAADTIMKEIDKDASGDIDLREFILFFRHIEELDQFQKKSAGRQKFFTILINVCFIVDMVVVGLLLMMFIRSKEEDDPDNYSIMKNVLLALSFVLVILFLMVILIPILRLSLGPSASRMQAQYEVAKEIKKAQSKATDDNSGVGPRQAAYIGDNAPPPINAALHGRSYRKTNESSAWAPSVEDMYPQPGALAATVPGTPGHEMGHAATIATNPMEHTPARQHVRKGNWRYDPSKYDVAKDYAEMQYQANLGPMTWSAMQVRSGDQNTNPAVLPGASLALTDAAMPYQNR
jgi:hypothetical protein